MNSLCPSYKTISVASLQVQLLYVTVFMSSPSILIGSFEQFSNLYPALLWSILQMVNLYGTYLLGSL